jgi:hypothetical protein
MKTCKGTEVNRGRKAEDAEVNSAWHFERGRGYERELASNIKEVI